ncbi:MAG TPA: iron-containing alcohol dehydrogenase [Draconibacterium sp.]|nr:iron-containing alcohol dehydrogenase [Draconibacterium sp.]
MSFNFSFATATRIVFGEESLRTVPGIEIVREKAVLLVTGSKLERAQKLLDLFPPGTQIHFYQVDGEPTIQMVDGGVSLARETGCEVVIGLGGGSVIDAAKAIAAMVPNPGELLDYLEVIGKGKALVAKPLPCIAIPTTAGTGAEVTKNSVIKSLENHVKVSLRSDYMYPMVAVVDPLLMHSMPSELTASTGVDALTHLMETFVSNQANPFIDMICREGLKRVSRSLLTAFHDGKNCEARADMAMAGMLGGMALANVKLGAVHGFAGPMGGMFPIPHGTVCASLMSATMEMNIEALTENNGNLSKYTELAQILTGSSLAKAEDGIVWAETLIRELGIPPLSSFEITENDFPELVAKAKVSSSMKGNPVELDNSQLTWILEKSL